MDVNILTLKWGTMYGPEYVNRLYAGVARHLTYPFRFLCFTDDARGLSSAIEARELAELKCRPELLGTTWIKLNLFQDGLANLQGPCLFLDLDLLITGNIDCFFEFRPGKRCIVHNWVLRHQTWIKRRPDVGNSSVFRFDAGTTGFILNKFYAEREWALANFRPPQTYLTYALGEKHYFPEEWVASFKRHCIPMFPLNLIRPPEFPRGARMVVFHGEPNPDVAREGYQAKRLHRRTLPAQWIDKHWQADAA